MALEKIVKNSSGVPTGEYERIAGGTLYADSPIGTILPYGGADAPSGWFLCQGQAISRTTYAELFAVIGTAFGSGDGSTTFNLPDMRESVPKGAGLTGHTVGNHLDADGLAVGEFLEDRVQTHEHYIGDSATPQHLGYSDLEGQNAGIGNRTVDATIESDRKWIALGQTNVGIARSGRYGDTTEVKSVGVNYIIKAKMVALPADFLAKVDEAIDENAKSPVSVSNKLVTESDLIVSANGDDSTALGTTVSSTWRITSNGSLCVCYGINTEAFNAQTTNMVSMQLPSGYIFDCVISANVFIDGNAGWVTGTSHTNGNGAGTYITASGTVNPGSFRQIVLAHKA